jgi:hypothetical protein
VDGELWRIQLYPPSPSSVFPVGVDTAPASADGVSVIKVNVSVVAGKSVVVPPAVLVAISSE